MDQSYSPRIVGTLRPDFHSLETLLNSPQFTGKKDEDLARGHRGIAPPGHRVKRDVETRLYCHVLKGNYMPLAFFTVPVLVLQLNSNNGSPVPVQQAFDLAENLFVKDFHRFKVLGNIGPHPRHAPYPVG